MSGLEAFAAALCATRPEALDEALAEQARLRIFDTLLATLVGRVLDDAKPLLAFHRVMVGDASGRTADLIRLHVALTRSTEIDDIELLSCVTPGSVVVPTALIVAAAREVDDATLLCAVVAGYEAMIDLGRAIGGAHLLYRGVWPTYATGPFGAAAVSATLLGLDAGRTANALALALARTALLTGRSFAGPSPRFHLLGCAAAEGYAAAEAAAAGLAGDGSILTGFGDSLGVEGLALTPSAAPPILDVDSKPFPTARQGLAAVEAFIAAKGNGRLEDIERVEVEVPAAYLAMIGRLEAPKDRIASLVSAAFQMASAGTGDLYDARRADLGLSGRPGLLGRIEFREAADLTARFPRQWGGRVTIHFASGERRAACVLDPLGSAAHPFGWDELRVKGERIFRASGLDPEAPGRLQDLCADLGRRPGQSTAKALLEMVRA